MLPVPQGVHVWLAPGHTDMRKGFPGLSLLAQETLAKDPHAGHLFVFRGRRGDLVKIIWHDGHSMFVFETSTRSARACSRSGLSGASSSGLSPKAVPYT